MGLVYQADVRMRTERMPLIKAKLEEEDAIAKQHGWPLKLDPAMPWGAVFKYAVEVCDKWWGLHCENPGVEVNCRVGTTSQYTDGDATISHTPGQTPTGSDTMTVQPAMLGGPKRGHPDASYQGQEQVPYKRRRGARVRAQPAVLPPAPATATRTTPCAGYQKGTCTQSPDGYRCAVNPGTTHTCSYCGKAGHGESSCWAKVETNPRAGTQRTMPWIKPGTDQTAPWTKASTKGGKGRGKGGKNKGKGGTSQSSQ